MILNLRVEEKILQTRPRHDLIAQRSQGKMHGAELGSSTRRTMALIHSYVSTMHEVEGTWPDELMMHNQGWHLMKHHSKALQIYLGNF